MGYLFINATALVVVMGDGLAGALQLIVWHILERVIPQNKDV